MTTPLDLLLAAGAVLGGLGVLIETLRRRRAPRPIPVTPTTVPPELADRVRDLLSEDKLVEAVKEVRRATGLGLIEAKRLVDGLSDGSRP